MNQKRLARLLKLIRDSVPKGELNFIEQIKANDSDCRGIKIMKLQSLFKQIMDSVDPLWQDLRHGLLNAEILNISYCASGDNHNLFIQDLLNLLQYLPKCKVIMLRFSLLYNASVENISLLLEKLEYLDVCSTCFTCISSWRQDLLKGLYERKLLHKFILMSHENDLQNKIWTDLLDDDAWEEIMRQSHTTYFRDYFSMRLRFNRINMRLMNLDEYSDDSNDSLDDAIVQRTYPDTPNYEMTECGFVE